MNPLTGTLFHQPFGYAMSKTQYTLHENYFSETGIKARKPAFEPTNKAVKLVLSKNGGLEDLENLQNQHKKTTELPSHIFRNDEEEEEEITENLSVTEGTRGGSCECESCAEAEEDGEEDDDPCCDIDALDSTLMEMGDSCTFSDLENILSPIAIPAPRKYAMGGYNGGCINPNCAKDDAQAIKRKPIKKISHHSPRTPPSYLCLRVVESNRSTISTLSDDDSSLSMCGLSLSSVASLSHQPNVGLMDVLNDNKLCYEISRYIPRLEHFQTWSQINKKMAKIFSIRNYSSTLTSPLTMQLYNRDASFFTTHIRHRYFGVSNAESDSPKSDSSKSDLSSNGGGNVVISLFAKPKKCTKATEQNSYSDSELNAMLQFYLLFYDGFIRLQQRYNREQKLRNPIPHACIRRSNPTLIHNYGNTFPIVVRSVEISTDIDKLQNAEWDWVVSLFKHSSVRSPLVDFDFSACQIDDSHLKSLSKAILSRLHFSTLYRIDLSHNRRITDGSMALFFEAMGKQCPKLSEVDLGYTTIGNRSCKSVANYFRTYVDLSESANKLLNVIWLHTNVTRTGEQQFSRLVTAMRPPSD